MKHFYSVSVFFLLSVLAGFDAAAQLITQKKTPYDLVKNTLLGTGITISNVKFNGVNSTQTSTLKFDNIGFFKGTTNLGIDSGIIMTTGTILNTSSGGLPEGPHGPNNSSNAGVDNGLPGDNDLNAIASSPGNPLATFNRAVLEFDFVPSYDTVKFRYVFGSEEWPENSGGNVNDAFGFFIRGPGISGSFSLNSKNIALIPNTNAYITINTVNNGPTNNGPCLNCAYYVDNQSIPGTTIQYDAFTTVLTAISHVQCGQTYHLKIAIADVNDGIYDSGVFLEALSFSSPVVTISSAVALGGAGHSGAAGDTVLLEGCGNAVLNFQRGGNTAVADTIHFTVAGTAAMGADFLNIPDSIIFPAGQNHALLTVQAIEDNLVEGFETLIFTPISNNPSSCVSSGAKPFKLYISDVVPLTVTASPDSAIICPNQQSTIDATVSGGLPGYVYSWNNGIGLGKRHKVAPAVTTTYTVFVTDTCGTHFGQDSVTITVKTYSPVVALASADVDIYCPLTSAFISAQASGGAGYYHYFWNNNAGTTAAVTVAPTTTTPYFVTITDTCGNSAQDGVIVNLINYPPLYINVLNDTTVCKGEPVTLVAAGVGGHGPYSYSWSNGSWLDSVYVVRSNFNKSYIVSVTDQCNYTVKDTSAVYISIPEANFGYRFDSNFLVQLLDSSVKNIVSYAWKFGDNSTSTAYNPLHEYSEFGAHDVSLVVTNDLGCKDSITRSIFPPVEIYIPTAFTPNGDGKNESIEAIGLGVASFELLIFNRWGQLVYKSTDIHQKWNASGLPEGVYVYQVRARGIDYKTISKTGTITLLR
ncbi:MAG: choice-of-anchor L domain-containing protein [Bacteroidetes bacterium]|nr:choice-of-anchor L domain-containing protein [Bacteroidota bacterium]